jgi:hypothetical protein
MAKTYKKRKKKGAGHGDLARNLLSKMFIRDIPVELLNQMTSQNSEMFRNLDRELYIRGFLEDKELIMTEQNIKKYAKKSKKDIDLQLNYLKEVKEVKEAKEAKQAKQVKQEAREAREKREKEAREKKEKEAKEKKEEEELKRRKTIATEFEPQIQNLINSKNEELIQIQKQPSKRETRSRKTSTQDNKIDKLKDEISKLKDHLRALRYRIINNFKGLSPNQDDMFYNYIDKYRTKSYKANY